MQTGPNQSLQQTAAARRSESGMQPDTFRLTAIDALRGFDMFCLLIAGRIVRALGKQVPHESVQFFVRQFSHPDWEGFTFYDGGATGRLLIRLGSNRDARRCRPMSRLSGPLARPPQSTWGRSPGS